MESVKRPLSPHLQIYKPQLTSILSITHRGTGVFLSLGALLLTCWLVGLATGEAAFNNLQLHASTWYGKVGLAAFVFSFYFHLANGIRHLFWDAGKGLEIYCLQDWICRYCLEYCHDNNHAIPWRCDMSLQTPIGRVRGLGSAKEGVHHWWSQRLTALALVPLSLWFIYSLVVVTGADYATVVAWLANPLNAVLMLLFIISLYYHAALGLQVIIEDYIDSEWQKIACLILVKFLALLAGLSAAIAVLKVYLGL